MPPEYREPAGDLPGAPSGHDMGVLMAILVVALAVRLAGLGAPLWFDEIVTVQTQLRLPWSAMMQSYSMNHHYLFSVEAKLATALFGETIWAIRLPALLFGLGTVAAVWWLARDVAGPRIAHVAALLVALSYHQVWFSQNARGYTELAFFSTLGLIFFLRGMERPARGTWIGFGLALAGAVFTHLTGVFFFAGLGLLWLGALGSRAAAGRLVPGIVARPLQGVFAAGVLLILLYLPVVPEVIRTIGAVAGTSAVDPMQEYQSPLWSVVEGLRSAIGREAIR